MKQASTLLMKAGTSFAVILVMLLGAGLGPLHAADPVKIGAVLSITGWAGSLGSYQKDSLTIVADDINRHGGVLGRPIEVSYEDDQSNPTNSAIAATKLIRDKKVSLLIGSTITVMCMPVIAICEREMTPNISLGAGHEITVPLKKWVFRIPLTDYRLSALMLQFTVNTLGARKIALIHSTDASGMMGARGILDTLDQYKDKGVSLVNNESFDPQDTNMIPQLTKIRASKPDAIILYTSAAPAAVVAKNWQQLGMEKMVVVGSHGVPTADFTRLAGKIVDGGQWILYGSKDNYGDQIPPTDPWRKSMYDPFMKALKEKYGRTDYQAPYGTAHEALRIAVEALKIAGTDDRAALRDALERIKYQGIIGEYVYSPTDHDGLAATAYGPIIIKNGKWWPYKK